MTSQTTITFTCAEVGENHVGMEAIDRQGNPGKKAKRGFLVKELKEIALKLRKEGYDAKVFDLEPPEEYVEQLDKVAGILIVRNFLDEDQSQALLEQASDLEWDSKYYDRRRKKVLNKHLRRNLLFADFAQEPNYEEGKGRVVPIEDVPVLDETLQRIENLFPLEKLKVGPLIAEGNLYHDPKKSGIGFHGDTERRIVIGFRVGSEMNLVYEWYHRSERIGKRYEFILGPGDLYAMSDKATGSDWRSPQKVTLRHAAGCKKVTR